MKTRTKTLLAALMLFAISCKKENNSIQSSAITNESSTQALSPEANELAGVHSVRIGTQVWKIRNLDVTHYRNGDRIPQVKDSAKWAALTTGAWCWYNNDSANGAVYGKLYNWYAVNDPRGLAPEGWHIPGNGVWKTLATFLGGEAVEGGNMKSTGTIEAGTGLWYEPNYGATNRSGFTGLPGGSRASSGGFYGIGFNGYWWSSTEKGYTYARNLNHANGYFYRYFFTDKRNGFSVRCLRD